MDKSDHFVLKTDMSGSGRIDTRPQFPEIEVLTVSAEDLRFWHWDWPEGDPFWRLYWNTGPGACVTWRKRVHLTENSLVLIAPHTPIRLRLNGAVGHLFMHFVVAPPFHHPHRKVWQIPVNADERARLRALFDGIFAGKAGRTGTLAPLAWIARALETIPQDDWQSSPMDSRVHKALQLMEAGVAETLSVDALASACSLSTAGFARLFRAELGVGPHRYLLSRRVECAARLLERSTLSMEQVAEKSGFSDRFHLTHVFKRLKGLAPAEFRRRQRGRM
jgi:AraC-like DNA-binding protein